VNAVHGYFIGLGVISKIEDLLLKRDLGTTVSNKKLACRNLLT
jgi:hypothetical protein